MLVVDDQGAGYLLADCLRAAAAGRVSALSVVCAPWDFDIDPVRVFQLSALPPGVDSLPLSPSQRLLVSTLWGAYPLPVCANRLAYLSGDSLPTGSGLRHLVRKARGKLAGSGWVLETVHGCGWRVSKDG